MDDTYIYIGYIDYDDGSTIPVVLHGTEQTIDAIAAQFAQSAAATLAPSATHYDYAVAAYLGGVSFLDQD